MTRRGPAVSVVIPCYRQAHYLEESVRSALAQEGCRPTVIVVDDGSDPPVAHPGLEGEQVHCLRQANRGVADARNTGLRASTGEFVVFLDADDRLAPGGIRAGLEQLAARPHAACAIGLCRVIDEAGRPRPFRQQSFADEDPFRALLRGNFVWMPAQVVFRRAALLRAGGFDPAFPACADYDLYLRIARSERVVCHEAVVAEYRQHDANMSGNGVLMLRSALEVLRRQWPFASERDDYRAAFAAGERFWREFYGDRVVEEVRAGLHGQSTLSRALRGTLALLHYAPGMAVRQVVRKLRVMAGARGRRPRPGSDEDALGASPPTK